MSRNVPPTISDLTGQGLDRLCRRVGVPIDRFIKHCGRPAALVHHWIEENENLPVWVEWILYAYVVIPESRTYPERVPLPLEDWNIERRVNLHPAGQSGPISSMTNEGVDHILDSFGISTASFAKDSGLSLTTAYRFLSGAREVKSPSPIWVDWMILVYWKVPGTRTSGLPPFEMWEIAG